MCKYRVHKLHQLYLYYVLWALINSLVCQIPLLLGNNFFCTWHFYEETQYWCSLSNSSQCTHSKHRFPAPSSKLCQIWLRHWRGTLYLRAAVHRRGQRLPKGLGTNMTVEAINLAPKHARKQEAHPPRVKKKSSVSIQTILVLFELAQTSWSCSSKTNVWYNLSCL